MSRATIYLTSWGPGLQASDEIRKSGADPAPFLRQRK
jgi:hypothetical protein